MIEKPTVFVIGAGAGVPFGFPTGADLTAEMAADGIRVPETATTHRDSALTEKIRGETRRLAKAVRNAQPKSIDDFLRERGEFADVGKLLIAAHLSKFEKPGVLFEYGMPEHWLRYLWHEMQARPDDFLLRNKAAFIVFNYDRCVEHFFTNVMASAYQVSRDDAWRTIRGFITHAHGDLGEDIPTDTDGACARDWKSEGARSFKPPETIDETEIAAKRIRFFWEEAPEARDRRESIDRLLQDAQYVVFLGFGYIASNLELFRVLFDRGDSANAPEIFGSCYGMRARERQSVELRFNGRINLGVMEPETFLGEAVPFHSMASR